MTIPGMIKEANPCWVSPMANPTLEMFSDAPEEGIPRSLMARSRIWAPVAIWSSVMELRKVR